MVDPYLTAGQLLGTAVWTAAALIPLLRRTVRGPPRWAFLAFCLTLAVYPVLDLLYLRADTAPEALAFVRGRMLAVGVAVVTFLLFARWVLVRMRRSDLLALPPAGLLLALAGAGFIVTDASPVSWGFALVRNMPLYAAWILFLYTYATLAVVYLVAGSRALRDADPTLYRGARVLAGSILGLLIIGFFGNVLFNVLGIPQVPLFSALLFIPGLAMVTLWAPLTRERLASLVQRMVSTHGGVEHAFLVYEGGTLIAGRSRSARQMGDQDLFTAVFEAITQYTHLRLRPFGGGYLDAIQFGDFKVLVERGRHCYLILVTSGQEDGLLRSEMQSLLRQFEERNGPRLSRWAGDLTELQGSQQAVDFLFRADQLF